MGTKGSGPYFQLKCWINLPALRLIHRRCFYRWRRRRYVCQQCDASFRSVPKTQNYREPEEYVGHLVSHKGISFTKVKRQKLMNFERSRTHKEMLMYIGLVNYFLDHARNMNDLLHPLRKMVERYDKHKRLDLSGHRS